MARTLKVNGKLQSKLTEKTLSIVENLATLNPSSGDFVIAAKSIAAIFPIGIPSDAVVEFQNEKKSVKFPLSVLRQVAVIASSGKIEVKFVNARGGSKEEAVITAVEI